MNLRQKLISERSLTVLLVLVAFTAFVGIPLLPANTSGEEVIKILFTFFFLSALLALRDEKQKTSRLLASALSFPIIALWARHIFQAEALVWFDSALVGFVFFSLALLLTAQLLRAKNVTSRLIQGAAASYLLLGIAWAHFYQVIDELRPGAFSVLGAPSVPVETDLSLFTYYSLITLCTVGYGDIVPVHPIARSLSTLEALVGQLYLLTVLGKLVSLESERKRKG